MNDNAESFSIPAEIKQEAQEATLRLLPAKSKRVYEKEMVEFDNWRMKRGLGEGAITEEVLLAYFFNVALILDVQDKGSYLYVLIPDMKTNISRSFTVMEEAFSVNAVEMCRKYISLRPKAAASFLGLPDPESFTGHGMRRSSATLLANAGADITTVKRYGGWKSTTVAENYIEESLSSKMAIAEKIQVLPNVSEVVGPSS
ncbi:hypothetical protein NQ315_012723, partial [Exocentrus adspersus]